MGRHRRTKRTWRTRPYSAGDAGSWKPARPKRQRSETSAPAGDVDLVIRFDGCAAPNPGPAAYGIVVESPEGWVLDSFGVGIGRATNNEAEWHGLIAALREAVKRDARRVRIVGDSKLVVEQANGRWKVRKPHLQPLQAEAAQLIAQLEAVSIEWASRDENELADSEACSAAQRGSLLPT
jgi:ribonuclease HI